MSHETEIWSRSGRLSVASLRSSKSQINGLQGGQVPDSTKRQVIISSSWITKIRLMKVIDEDIDKHGGWPRGVCLDEVIGSLRDFLQEARM